MAEELYAPDQPDGIESDSLDLPTPDAAAKRVGEYLEWWGDGLIDTLGPNARHEATPLYARDLQALVNSARDRDLLLWLHAEAVWKARQGCSEGCDLTPRDPAMRPTAGQMLHQLHGMSQADQVGFMQRMIDASETAVHCFTRDHEGRLGHRDQLMIEVSRLRREVEFEANPEEFYADIAFSRDNLRQPLCACITDEQAAALAPGFSRPVCTVHPGGEK